MCQEGAPHHLLYSMLEELQNGLYQRAKENREAKFNTLHDKIYRMDVLEVK